MVRNGFRPSMVSLGSCPIFRPLKVPGREPISAMGAPAGELQSGGSDELWVRVWSCETPPILGPLKIWVVQFWRLFPETTVAFWSTAHSLNKPYVQLGVDQEVCKTWDNHEKKTWPQLLRPASWSRLPRSDFLDLGSSFGPWERRCWALTSDTSQTPQLPGA